ncbi:MAG TPA: substrate-binding domain-containing protein [Geminicoccaceae bacterium]
MSEQSGPSELRLLCAGAAQGVVKALQAEVEAAHGVRLVARYGAVGGLRDALLAGERADAVVLSAALVDGLVAAGRLDGGSRATLGRVETGLAVPRGAPHPDASGPDAVRAAFERATTIWFPDPVSSTAGIHVMRVLDALGLRDAVASKLRPHPNGATAMRAMADAGDAGAVGCTQVTEILYTEGVEPVGPLPPPLDLATAYDAAVVSGTAHAAAAQALVRRLADPESAELRARAGFTSGPP